MSKIDEIRKRLKEMEGKGNTFNDGEKEASPIFKFWNIDDGDNARLRFLPDKDDKNIFFWKEKQVIKLPFPGIKGGDEHKEVEVSVPCMDMYDGEKCPIIAETKPWWDDESLKPLALKYWKKRNYYFQGFVIESDMKEDKVPENPIRIFSFTNQIYKIIKSSMFDPDFDDLLPTDYVSGLDFVISKGKSGKYADYSTSKWARKETALTEEQLDAVEKYGLFNLNDFMPKKPTPEQVSIIYDMFTASMDGELYDPQKWGEHYRPWGFNFEKDASAPANNSTDDNTYSVDDTDDSSVSNDEDVSVTKTPKKSTSDDILAAIRQRAKA